MGETKLLTVGEIAKQLNCPIHKVLYLIQSRQIKPFQRAGCLRIFGEDVVDMLRSELTVSQQRHSTKKQSGPGVVAGVI